MSCAQTITLNAPGGPRLAGLLWSAPEGAPGVVIVPGFGSRKDNHADYGEALRAAGMAALALDVRGHGDSDGALDAGAMDDVLAAVGVLAGRGHAPLGVRGSSMGALLALHAPDRDPRVRTVVAICPARPDGLAELTDDPWPFEFDPESVVQTGDGVARGYWHAMGDEVVPWNSTLALAGLSTDPKFLHIVPRGGHRSLQHNPEIIAETIAFLTEHLSTP